MDHPLFEIVTTKIGAVSIRNKALNEIMHNPVGPWAEANALYVEQSRLKERLLSSPAEELVVYDVGLGAAANALASLHAHRATPNPRPLRLISFERDLELLRFALAHSSRFAHFHGFENVIETLLARGEWRGPNAHWELRHGDFRETLAREANLPHLIYYDPYSSKTNREMWSVDCFRQIRAKCRDERAGGTVLYTYTQATGLRVALLTAGFYVGHGVNSGPKEETTQASSSLALLENPLAGKWFARWSRSLKPFPMETRAEDEDRVRAFVRGHEQFANLNN